MSERAKTRTIRTDYLARVEGEGAMFVRIKGNEVVDVQLKIYEPPRFFEMLLRGRQFTEAPDVTARICGICPVAYQMSSIAAMEEICGVEVSDQIRALRRLLYCGEWIESHTLHVYMLHAPDFLGYASAVELARDHRDVVERALQLKKIGNEVMRVVGGREVHPINVRVGGWYRAPTQAELRALVPQLEWAREAAVATVGLVGGFDFPDFEADYEFVALRQPGEYPIERGRIVSSSGLDIAVSEYEAHFVEEHVERSNALHSTMIGKGAYLVGPLARYALNSAELSEVSRAAAAAAGLGPVCRNPFQSIVVRAVETVEACNEALRLIEAYERPDPPALEVVPRSGSGCGCTEAPRGILWHRYTIDGEGTILDAKIVPPTSQNQKMIEEDLGGVVRSSLDLPDAELALRCEQTIRNYDPCISCATHFLKLEVERT